MYTWKIIGDLQVLLLAISNTEIIDVTYYLLHGNYEMFAYPNRKSL